MPTTNATGAALQTIYFAKTFTSGKLKGLAVQGSITGTPLFLRGFRLHATGRDMVTGSRWVITDASFQSFAR